MRRVVKNRVAELVAIKARNEGRRINKTTLFEETGLGRSTVETWMANQVTRFDSDVMLAWCEYLGCEVADLFVVEEIESPERKAYSTSLSVIPA
jgi:DNA-binding Xre family transcriptional regulator